MEIPLTEDRINASDGSHNKNLPRALVLKDNSFVSGVVEDILTISHVEEALLEKDSFETNGIAGGKKSRGRKEK